MDALGEPGGIGQQMTHRRGPVCGVRGDQLVRAQIVVRCTIEINKSLFPQLHHGDGGERLRERPYAEDGVFAYRRVRSDIGESVTVEELQLAVTDDPDGETDGWMATEDLTDFGIQLRSPLRPAFGDQRAHGSRLWGSCRLRSVIPAKP
jgi:hypothetical protein